MYLDIRFYLKCLTLFFICLETATRDVLWKWVFSGVLQDSRGELLCQGLFFSKVAGLWLVALLKGLWCRCYSCEFCESFGSIFFTEHFWMTASVCSFYNLKGFICDILQIYKLRKNMLLDIILYITCIYFCVSYVLL